MRMEQSSYSVNRREHFEDLHEILTCVDLGIHTKKWLVTFVAPTSPKSMCCRDANSSWDSREGRNSPCHIISLRVRCESTFAHFDFNSILCATDSLPRYRYGDALFSIKIKASVRFWCFSCTPEKKLTLSVFFFFLLSYILEFEALPLFWLQNLNILRWPMWA